MRSFLISTASRLRSSFCSLQLGVHLVQNRHLLRDGDSRVHKQLAQLGALVPGGKKIIQLLVRSSAAVSSFWAVTTSAKARA
jgi:hypothetical protein